MADKDLQAFEEEAASEQQIYARELLRTVSLNLKLATLHQISNKAFDRPVGELLDTVNPALSTGEVQALQCVGPNFFVNREAIKLDATTFESGERLLAVFERIGIGEISFCGEQLEEPEWREFLAAFQEDFLGRDPTGFRARRFPGITVRSMENVHDGGTGVQIDERQNVLRCYASLALMLEGAVAAVERGQQLRIARVRRTVQALIDATPGHESLVVGLTRFPNLSGEPHYHLAAVSALVMLMARQLELGRSMVSELTLAAALHGLVHPGVDTIEVGTRSDALEEAMTHAQGSLASILAISDGGLSADTLGYISVAYECNLPVTATLAGSGTSLAARMVAVACSFDLMTTLEPPEKPVLPDQAMRIILDRAGTCFDEQVVRLFALTIGLYPVGTTLRLSGGELAVVIEVPGDPARFARPRVKVVRDRVGPADYVLDLADNPDGTTIIESVDPVQEEINAAYFLLA